MSNRTGDFQPRLSMPAAREALEARANRAADQVVAGRQPSRVGVASRTSPARSPATAGQSAGSQLEPRTRAWLETRLGADFSTVRIHADGRAAEAADRQGAQAYTDGEAIVFADGAYRPDSSEGLHLLAHEATHVLQQRAGVRGIQRKPAAHKTKEAAVKALKKSYSIADVIEGGGTWTVEELNMVIDALAMVPAADVAALKGVKLSRAETLTDAEGKPRDGEFAVEQTVDDATVTNTAELRLADSAFSDVGQLQDTVIHEAGHAVASKPRRDAFGKELKATATFNQKVDAQNKTADALTTAADEMNPIAEEANAIKGEFDALLLEREAVKGDKAAVAAIDAQLKDLKKRHAAKSKELAPATKKHAKAEKADKAATKKKEDAQAAKDTAKAAADETLADSGETKRVQKFVDFVTDKGIDPITQYAKDNWPGNPEEFYADAYAMFLTDPEALKAASGDLFDWFKAGNYK
jgi:hypothetical protein